MKYKWFVLILFFCCARGLTAQTYNFEQFNEESGLEQTYIYSISQSSEGYLYMSTGEGIYRFDGRFFKSISNKKTAASFVKTHFIDDNNVVWMGHNQNGVSFLRGEEIISLPHPEILEYKVNQIFQIKQHKVLVATGGGGLFKADTSGKIVPVKMPGLELVNALLRTSDGRILAGTSGGVEVIEENANGELKKNDKLTFMRDRSVKQIVAGESKDFYWVLTEYDGIFGIRFKNGSFVEEITLKDQFEEKNIACIFADNIHNLWVSIVGEGIRKISFPLKENLHVNHAKLINKSNGLKSTHIQSVFQDNEGNLWFGTFGDGLIRKHTERFSFYGEKEGVSPSNIKKVGLQKPDVLWLATATGISSLDRSSGKTTFFPVKENETVNTLLCDTDKIWIGTSSSLLQMDYKTKKIKDLSKELKLPSLSFNCFIRSGSRVIAGTTEGLYFIDDGSSHYEVLTTNSGLLHNNVISLFMDSKNRLWICSHGTPLYYIANDKVKSFKDLSGNVTFKINAVTEDKDGNIWIATDGDGVFQFDNKKFHSYTTTQGLLSDFCNGITIDANGSVWVTHRAGLSEKRQNSALFRVYNVKSGLIYFENNFNSFYNDEKKDLWFGTNSGLVHYESDLSSQEEVAPRIYLQKLTLNNEEQKAGTEISKKYGYYSVHIDYFSISLSNPDNIFYKYRLLDVDSTWRVTKTPYVDFPKLSDGNYTFEVIACNNKNGLCGDEPARTTFKIKKPVWKLTWFYVLVIGIIVLLTYFIIRFRTKRLVSIQQLLQLKVKQKTLLLQREKEAVERIKVELENRNKDITDSISYARNIQYSILPPDEVMEELFGKKYFVLFKPKDIVSGDFYWAAALNVNNNNKKALSLAAVIDCTGHGVPGAFLSIMANDFLKQSIIDRDVNNTNEILDFLNEEVSSHLNQSFAKNRMSDGMDIALVGVDSEEKKLYYSGANNPVYVLRKNGKAVDIFILKATKQAIGFGTERVKSYGVEVFDLIEGDTIYLFSDGFADQFGGENNKKFTYRRFRDLLGKAYQLPIADQKEYLELALESWKNGTEQTDDVCVMGIRI